MGDVPIDRTTFDENNVEDQAILKIDLTKNIDIDNLKDKLDELNNNLVRNLELIDSVLPTEASEFNSFDDLQANFEKQ
mgnify:CR=1 FL=1